MHKLGWQNYIQVVDKVKEDNFNKDLFIVNWFIDTLGEIQQLCANKRSSVLEYRKGVLIWFWLGRVSLEMDGGGATSDGLYFLNEYIGSTSFTQNQRPNFTN